MRRRFDYRTKYKGMSKADLIEAEDRLGDKWAKSITKEDDERILREWIYVTNKLNN